jgi:hypothetical protein
MRARTVARAIVLVKHFPPPRSWRSWPGAIGCGVVLRASGIREDCVVHPNTFYTNLFEYKKREEVFVVMSFSDEFNDRWVEVIEPTIREGLGLKANRVDYNVSGESIVHDIIDGIAHSRLVLADITSYRLRDGRGMLWPQRNGNVMWEVGIAHTMRMPDEVLLVRSDGDESIFDLTQFRAFTYHPSNIDEAKAFLLRLAKDRLKSTDQIMSDQVLRCVDALDPSAIELLINRIPATGDTFTVPLNMLNIMRFPRLFELGLIRTTSISAEVDAQTKQNQVVSRLVITEFGKAVMRQLFTRLSIPREQLDKLLSELSLDPIPGPY